MGQPIQDCRYKDYYNIFFFLDKKALHKNLTHILYLHLPIDGVSQNMLRKVTFAPYMQELCYHSVSPLIKYIYRNTSFSGKYDTLFFSCLTK